MATRGEEITPEYFLKRQYTTVDELQDALDRAALMSKPSEYANELAIGVYTDDINGADPATVDSDVTDMEAGLVVVVHKGKLRGLSISDEYLEGVTPEEFTVILNSVIQNAYAVWAEVYSRLFAAGAEMINEIGLEPAVEIMDEEIADSREE